ncbi:MAG TPA: SusC/RagA family TonB-linked outer membrane protein [Gemmatimonadaceae bacterium]|nr:SusC/RagA family TonB-linked outer membrane protein [Gemmatimonadaceae bacterium]
MSRVVRLFAAALLAIPLLAPAARAQQVGTITGRVVDADDQQPLPEVQVLVVGTTIGARTGADGRYRISGVSAGQHTLRTLRLGYASATLRVDVPAGGNVEANFTLQKSVSILEQVVVTATGAEQRRREAGNSVGTINVDSVELAPVQTFSQLINGRVAGLSVLESGGTTGTGARIRIRGANSLSLSNEPLIIVDGARLNSDANSLSIDVGGQEPSRLNDINPDDIENVEVLRGPAATGLYGTQAANGVIQITTKHGRSGRTRWTMYAEGGAVNENNHYPANFGGWGDTDTDFPTCDLITQSFGACTQDSLAVFNPLETHSPFRTGFRQQYGLSLAGGNERTTFFLSGDYENEDGVYRTNDLQRYNLRANVSTQLRDELQIRVNTGYLSSDLDLPGNDNTFFGYVSNGLAGLPIDGESQGYDPIGPDLLDQILERQEIERYTASVNGDYRPLSWLSVNGTVGLDIVNRFDSETFPTGVIQFFGEDIGSRQSNRFQSGTYTSNVSAAGTFELTPDVHTTTTAGFQWQREMLRGTLASGFGLAAGTGGLGGATQQFAVGETTIENILLGGFLQEQVGWKDRLFVTGSVRGDDNSAFGENLGVVYYPTASVSWVLSDEPFFPRWPFLTSFRLRSSYGQSGLRPGNRDALIFFTPIAARVNGQEVAGVTAGGLGDPDLKPEKVREYEVGFDAQMFDNRASVDFTFYDKRSHDALVARRLPASVGQPATRLENLGSVSNRGVETTVSVLALDRPGLSWSVNGSFGYNRNRLDQLGEGIATVVFGFDGLQRFKEGASLGSYWGVPVTHFADDNGDGIISLADDEIQFGDEEKFLGNSIPSTTASVSTDVTFLKYFRVSTLFDYRGGFKLYNSSESFRCAILRCRGANDATASLQEQAAAIAGAVGVVSPFVENAEFWKWRELSLTISAPSSLAARFGVEGLSLTLAGRNLATFTDYGGVDPEVNAVAQDNFSSTDFLSQPQVRRFNARITVQF